MLRIYLYDDENDYKELKAFLSRSLPDYSQAALAASEIVENVRINGDSALFEYTKKFDGFVATAKNVVASHEEFEEARGSLDTGMLDVIRKAARRITDFHLREKRNGWLETKENGEILGQLYRPLESAGVYVPGGKAAYPSSVLMNVIPARVAGVKSVVMATPAGKDGKINPAVLVAAETAGVDAVYKIGGAQAVAAFAYGTESVPKVDKITGPGNVYVQAAKRAVFGTVGIDSIAGPSEILIIADETANPVFVAADMLSQAEHDELSRATLVTTDENLAKNVQSELEAQTARLGRKSVIDASLNNNGAIIVVKTLEDAAAISNEIAPEHLELCVNEPLSLLPLVQNAGAVFMGHYTPEPLGDYMAGPSHVLPTNGTARFFSPLSTDDFMKKTSVLSFGKEAFTELSKDVARFAEAEGLTAHANAIYVRRDTQ